VPLHRILAKLVPNLPPRSVGRASRNTRTRERGASIVEFALVLPLFVALVMGIVDFSINFTNVSSVRQATREGARRATVGDPSDSTCSLVGLNDDQESSMSGRLLCSVHDSAAVIGTVTRTKIVFPSNYETGKEALMCTQYQVQSVTGFFKPLLTGRYSNVKTQMRIERVETGIANLAETPFSGQNWNWCA
jgi:TadE-like protein